MRLLLAQTALQSDLQKEVDELHRELFQERARALAEHGELREAAAQRECTLERALVEERGRREAAEGVQQEGAALIR